MNLVPVMERSWHQEGSWQVEVKGQSCRLGAASTQALRQKKLVMSNFSSLCVCFLFKPKPMAYGKLPGQGWNLHPHGY